MSVSARTSRIVVALVAAGLLAIPLGGLFAGHQFFRGGAVGGVSIDASGVVREANVESLKLLLEHLRKTVKPAEEGLQAPVEMRKVSLKGLEAAIEDAIANNFGLLPEEVQFMAGLQRIQYILVDKENHDIILAGPGEGWRVDEKGNIVGVTTGRPVLRLDDFLVALRTVDQARQGGITCSIDPTPEGIRRAEEVLELQRKSRTSVIPARLGPALKQAMGPQTVTITGVPSNTHFARIMLAADFLMKRLAMNVDKAPVDGFPSYIELLAKANGPMPSPRWWLACNYEGVTRSEDSTVWELNGPGVKALTEENLIRADGTVEGRTGRTSKLAEEWAEMMTEKYDALCGRIAAFGELRNLMDMCVVAAVIEMHDLRTMADCSLPLLYNSTGPLATENWNSPKVVDTVCSFAPTRGGWLVATAGGVQIESWQVADTVKPDAKLGELAAHTRRAAHAKWWWN